MKLIKITALMSVLLLLNVSAIFAQNGSGDIRLGYVYIDEEGNQSVSHSSFNYYDGPVISLENFRYRFNNGLQLKSNLRNLNIDSRNLYFGLEKTGKFGVDVNSNRYRRVYDFNGNSETKRDLTSAGIWLYPNKHLKVFADGSFNSVSGEIDDMFNAGPGINTREIDYDRSKYALGARIKYNGSMFHAEYNMISYTDNNDELKDQSRDRIKLIGFTPLPGHEWILLSGQYLKFETKYDVNEIELKSTTLKGSVLARFSKNISVNYIAFYNRAGSDDDLVETDNIAHLIYASYNQPKQYGFTVGYQKDTNDDFEEVVEANSYYFSGWLKPVQDFEVKIESGLRSEEVEEGFRLTGNEDRNRLKVYAKYKLHNQGSVKIGFESKERENEQLESEADFKRYYFESNLRGLEYFILSGGYSYSEGEYTNSLSAFEFTSKQVYLNINSKEYKSVTGSFGLTYYRNKLDLDTEGINLLFKGSYKLGKSQRAELTYKVFNFDDFLVMDQYYTENIVEFNIIKTFSF